MLKKADNCLIDNHVTSACIYLWCSASTLLCQWVFVPDYLTSNKLENNLIIVAYYHIICKIVDLWHRGSVIIKCISYWIFGETAQWKVN